MAQAKMVFSYLGPVRVYDDITTNKWGGTTMAVSEKQARNNLAHQYRKQRGLLQCVPVKMTGELTSYNAPIMPPFRSKRRPSYRGGETQ